MAHTEELDVSELYPVVAEFGTDDSVSFGIAPSPHRLIPRLRSRATVKREPRDQSDESCSDTISFTFASPSSSPAAFSSESSEPFERERSPSPPSAPLSPTRPGSHLLLTAGSRGMTTRGRASSFFPESLPPKPDSGLQALIDIENPGILPNLAVGALPRREGLSSSSTQVILDHATKIPGAISLPPSASFRRMKSGSQPVALPPASKAIEKPPVPRGRPRLGSRRAMPEGHKRALNRQAAKRCRQRRQDLVLIAISKLEVLKRNVNQSDLPLFEEVFDIVTSLKSKTKN